MKFLLILLFSTTLLPVLSFAQSNYKPGYVLSLQGDTLRGLIDYKEWDTNPVKVTFKNSVDAQARDYTAADINGFGVTGFEYYTKFILPVGKDQIDVANLSTGIDTSVVVDSLFLKKLAGGNKIILYRYWDNIKERFFITKAGGLPVELIYRVYVDPENVTNIHRQYSYRRQLLIAVDQLAPAQQNSELKSTINNAEYSGKDLQKIIVLINGKLDNSSFTDKGQNGTQLFAGVGLNISSVKSEGFNDIGGSKSYLFPDIDLGADFFLNKDIRSFVIRVELNVTANKTSLSGISVGTVPFNSNLSFKEVLTTLSPQLLFNFYNTVPTKVYVSAGAIVYFAAYSNKSYLSTSTESGFASYSTEFPNVQSVFINGDIKVGAELGGKFNIYAGYTPPVKMNDNNGSSLNLSTFQIGINYLFGFSK